MTRARTGALIACVAVLWASPALAQESPVDRVIEAVRAHDDREALRRLDELPANARRGARMRYLAGRLQERLGDHAKAAREWEGLVSIGAGDEGSRERPLPPAIARDLRFRFAAALARSGRCEDALPALVELSSGTGSRPSVARALRGRCAMLAGDLATAIDLLRAAAREDARDVDTFAVRMHLAEALHEMGDRGSAVAELRSLLVDRPEHPDADAALAQLESLGADFDPSDDDRMARAERFIRLRRPRDALSELDALGPVPRTGDVRARYVHLRGQALFGTRHDYAEAARVLTQSSRLRGPHAIDDELDAATALLRSEQPAAAVRAYRRFSRRHRDHPKAAEAEYLAARTEIRLGRAAGRRNMRRFLDAHPRGRLAEDAAWDLAFAELERGRHGAAAELFDRYAQLGDDSDAMVRGRGLYWLGRARLEMGQRAQAIAAWRSTIAVEPLHWYALLARERLLAAGEDPGDPFPTEEPRAAEPSLPERELEADVAFYDALGLEADAIAALRRHEDAIAAAAPNGRGLEAITRAYQEVGAASRPYRLVATRARDELVRAPDPRNRWVWDAAYPRPYADDVRRLARIAGVAPETLWAIMRQESGYDPEAVSYADAIGLLQLLPSTAAEVARRHGVEMRREMLFDPRWNLRFASAYFGGLHSTFDRHAPLAIGAYNAGGHRMRRWLDEAPEAIELDRFVERIPYDQTRNYVRRVTTHLARYLYLTNPEQGWPLRLDLELPD